MGTTRCPQSRSSTPAQRIIAAATRLRESWAKTDLDIVEVHEATLGLILITGMTDLASALGCCTTSAIARHLNRDRATIRNHLNARCCRIR